MRLCPAGTRSAGQNFQKSTFSLFWQKISDRQNPTSTLSERPENAFFEFSAADFVGHKKKIVQKAWTRPKQKKWREKKSRPKSTSLIHMVIYTFFWDFFRAQKVAVNPALQDPPLWYGMTMSYPHIHKVPMLWALCGVEIRCLQSDPQNLPW